MAARKEASSAGESERFEVVMLATPEIDHYAAATRLSWERYCARHGYDFFLYDRKILGDLHINWSRVEMVRERQRAAGAHWVVMVDADTFVVDESFDLERLVAPYAGKDILFAPDATRRFGLWLPLDLGGFVTCRTWRPPNGGFILVRNNDFGRQFFDEWLALARGPMRHLANRHPRTQGVLWRGLYRRHREGIAVMRGEVVRAGTNRVLDRLSLDTSEAFVLHDKRLTLRGNVEGVPTPAPAVLLESDASLGG
ncbi:MAG: hypothetical protein WB783_07535 [Arenicellales bacterium]